MQKAGTQASAETIKTLTGSHNIDSAHGGLGVVVPACGGGYSKEMRMVLGDTQKLNMYWQLVINDLNDENRKYVYHGGAFVDIVYKDRVIDTFSVWDFDKGRRTVDSVEQLLLLIERRINATDK